MRHWRSNQHESVPWASGTVSFAATAALFAAAFVAMRTVRFTDFELPRRERSQTNVVELTPPLPRFEPPPVVRRPPPALPSTPTSVPTTIPAPTATPTPAAVPAAPVMPLEVAPTVPRDPVRDSTRAASDAPTSLSRLLTDLVPMREVPTFPRGGAGDANAGRRGAPMAPAGVTGHSGNISPATRDSIMVATMAGIAEAAARLPGPPSTVPLRNGAVGIPIIKIDVPIFSPGPSPAERKRNEAIHADNMLRLRRMQDRLALRRDSVRADSLKRDSVAKAARPVP